MARPKTWTIPANASTAICTAQTATGAGQPLTINGTLLDLPATMGGTNRVVLPGYERNLTVTATAAVGAGITVSGIDLRGAVVTETITCTGNTTAAGTSYFARVNSVAATGAMSVAASVGTGSLVNTNWFRTSDWKPAAQITVTVGITTAGPAVTVQDTQDPVQVATPTTIFNHPTIASATQSMHSNYAFPPRFVRATATAVGSGAFTFTVIQAG